MIRSSSRRRNLTGLAFASPWIVGFGLVTALPLIATALYSLTDYSLFGSPRGVGLDNYADLIKDDRYITSITNTLYLTVISVPLATGLALLVALALSERIRGRSLWRAVIYLPTLVPIVVATFVWRWLLNGEYGYVNQLLHVVGLSGPAWLLDPAWTKPAIVLVGLWTIGGNTVIYIAALNDVPRELYDAAAVDGAGRWARFRYVTWPTISPVTLFLLVVGVIVSLQIFAQPYLLAQNKLNTATGGPADSMLTYTMYLFQNAFVYLRMGYASAQAVVLFVATMAVTTVILRSSRRWVHHES